MDKVKVFKVIGNEEPGSYLFIIANDSNEAAKEFRDTMGDYLTPLTVEEVSQEYLKSNKISSYVLSRNIGSRLR